MYTYRDIEFELKKSPRKTTSIYVERDGTISVLAPEPYDMAEIEKILETKRSWIYKNLAEWEDLNRTRVEREFVNGEGFPYMGSTYRLQITDDTNKELCLKNGMFVLKRSSLSDAREKFIDFYKDKARNRIPKLVEHNAKAMGLNPKSINVQELQNRWASCTAEGVLNFHWRCMMAPLSALEYIVVHELAHLKHLNHTPEFWYAVEKVLPDYQQSKGWLRLYGAGLEL